jgi:hypothetical protein
MRGKNRASSEVRGWKSRYALIVRPGFGPADNPLRRRADRRQAVAAGSAFVLLLASVPLALLIALGVWHHTSSVAAEQAVTRRLATVQITSRDRVWAGGGELATVTWRDRHGTAQQALTMLGGDTAVGSSVRLWTDNHGDVVRAPMSRSDAVVDSIATAVGALVAVVLIALVGFQTCRCRQDQARYRSWDVEWRELNQVRPEGSKG